RLHRRVAVALRDLGVPAREERRLRRARRGLALRRLGSVACACHCGQRLGLRRDDSFRAAASRTRDLKARSLSLSPSKMSMARRTLPSRLELKRPEGASSDAALGNVSFTLSLYVSPVQMMPSCSHVGTPRHFHSSTTSGTVCWIRGRIRARTSPRQSASSLILASISSEGEFVSLLGMAQTLRDALAGAQGTEVRSRREKAHDGGRERRRAEAAGEQRGRDEGSQRVSTVRRTCSAPVRRGQESTRCSDTDVPD